MTLLTSSKEKAVFLGAPFVAVSMLWMATILPLSPIYVCVIPLGLAICYGGRFQHIKFSTYFAYGGQLLFCWYLYLLQILNGAAQHDIIILIFAILFYIMSDYMISPVSNFSDIKKIANLFLIIGALYILFDFYHRVRYADTTNIPPWILNNPIFSFYIYKEAGIHGDSNATGIVSVVLLGFNYYYRKLLVKGSKEYKYNTIIKFALLALWITTFCRSAWFAFITFLIIMFFFKQNIFIKFTGTIFIFIGIIYAISKFIMDPSFGTKIEIFQKTLYFLQTYPTHELLFGVGPNNSCDVIGYYAHNFISIYIIEYGIIGFVLYALMFFFIIFDVGKPALFVLIPYSINALSYTPLHITYVFSALVLIKHCERLRPKQLQLTSVKKHTRNLFTKYVFAFGVK